MMLDYDPESFGACVELATSILREGDSIGTYGEKTVHLALKYYFEPDLAYHEVGVGRHIADICRENDITEIQSAGFNNLRSKIKSYREKGYYLRVVYPLLREKRIFYIDEDGSVFGGKKSPKKGNALEIYKELYKISAELCDRQGGVEFLVCQFDADEYRLVDKEHKKSRKGYYRFDRIPTLLCGIYRLRERADHKELIPESLRGGEFCAKELARAAKISYAKASCAMLMMFRLGVLSKTRKQGKTNYYALAE